MRRLVTAVLVLVAASASAQTTTTRTDRLIVSTQAIIGATSLGANTLNVTGTLGVSGAATFDTSTLVVDATNNRVGIGEASPAGTVSIYDPTTAALTMQYDGQQRWWISASRAGYLDIGANGGTIPTAGAMVIDSAGQAGVGTSTASLDARLVINGNVYPSAAYSGNIGALTKKWLTIHAAELWVQTLVAQDVISTIGGRILVLPTTLLSADLGDGAGDTTITVKHNNLASGDRIYLEANAKVEFMAVTSSAGGSAGAYTYSVTRNLDGSGRNLWNAGDAVANTGTTGDGWIDLYSVRGVASVGVGPTIVGNERLSATYNDWEPRWAVGNLNGLYGYSADTYGAAFGDDDTANLVIDSTNGIRFRNGTAVLGSWVGSTVTLGQPLTANNTGRIVIDSDSIDLDWRNNSGVTSKAFGVSNSGGTGLVSTIDLSVTGNINLTGNLVNATASSLLITATLTGADIILTPGVGGFVQVGAATDLRPASDNNVTLGTSSLTWSELYLTPATTTSDEAPLVITSGGQVQKKTDGISATFNPTGCSSLTFESGILTARSCP